LTAIISVVVDQRLHRLYGSLNGLTRPSHEVSISADTIQFLVAILKEFISEVVRGSLISKEQEIRLKGTLKVWKYNQNEVCIAIRIYPLEITDLIHG
jgi:hypothetical protein